MKKSQKPRHDIKKKFISPTTNFRKELRKIKDSQKSCLGCGEAHQSTLWCFAEFQFLAGQKTPPQPRSTTSLDEEEEQDEMNATSSVSKNKYIELLLIIYKKKIKITQNFTE